MTSLVSPSLLNLAAIEVFGTLRGLVIGSFPDLVKVCPRPLSYAQLYV